MVPSYVVDKLRRLYSRAHISKTKDRSVAGSLNQFTKELKWVVAEGYRRSPSMRSQLD